MNGPTSQLVTLCSAGNASIAGRFDINRFFPEHPDFRICREVRFVDVKKRLFCGTSEREVAANPNEWLADLVATKARRAAIHHHPTPDAPAPDHKLVAFVGGGGTWSLFVDYGRHWDRWVTRWKASHRPAPEKDPWRVTYGRIESGRSTLPIVEHDLDRLRDRFKLVLDRAKSFATNHNLPHFAKHFRRGIEALSISSPISFPDHVQIVCLDAFSIPAQKLLSAAYHSWVFGGMGSWNDLGFESAIENQMYEEISAELYAATNDAIQHATNSFAHPH